MLVEVAAPPRPPFALIVPSPMSARQAIMITPPPPPPAPAPFNVPPPPPPVPPPTIAVPACPTAIPSTENGSALTPPYVAARLTCAPPDAPEVPPLPPVPARLP